MLVCLHIVSIFHIVPSLVQFLLPLYCSISHGVCLCMCLHSTHSSEGSRDGPGQQGSLHSQVCVFVSGGDQFTEVTLLLTHTHTELSIAILQPACLESPSVFMMEVSSGFKSSWYDCCFIYLWYASLCGGWTCRSVEGFI